MMNSMRKMASGFVAKLLMLFLVITFGVWGIGDVFRDSGATYAAKVGDRTISIVDFQRQKAQVARRAEAMGLKDMNPNMLDVGILRQMVQQKLVVLTLEDLGLYIGEPLVAKTLRAEPAFQNKDGSFNKEAFTSILKNERITEASLLSQVKDDMSTQFLLASMDVSDVPLPAPARELNATAALETRDAWIVSIAAANAPTIINEAALKEFYEKNKSVLYVKPESRTLEYVALKPQQIEAAIDNAITESMIAEAKKSQPTASTAEIKTRLRQEQREPVMHALEAALDDALAGGATLSEALSKANLSAPIRTLVDVKESAPTAEGDEVIKTVTQQGFQMGDGETSGLIMSPNGTPLVVHVKSLQVAGAQPYETVSRDVHDRVAEHLRGEAARQRVQEVKTALNAITGEKTDAQLKAVLDRFGLTARPVTGIARPKGNAVVNGIPASLQQAIFERQVGSVAGPLTLASGNQMLAIVTKLHHPDAATVAAKSKLAGAKEASEEAETLTQTVQALGFNSFAEKHRVKINAQLLSRTRAPSSGE